MSDIRKALGDWRKNDLAWVYLPEPLPLSWDIDVAFKEGRPARTASRFRMHRLVAAQTQAWLTELHQQGLWHTLKDFGGAYYPRRIRGGLAWSAHSWSYAVDFNTRKFPLGSKDHQDPTLLTAAARWGFLNGERFSRPDPMHFEVERFVVPVYDSAGRPHPGSFDDGVVSLPIREIANALGVGVTWDERLRTVHLTTV